MTKRVFISIIFIKTFFLKINPFQGSNPVLEKQELSKCGSLPISNENLRTITNAIDLFPEKYIINGTVDYTHILQKIIDDNDVVLLPNFPMLIADSGLRLKSNSEIIFQKHTQLILSATAKQGYAIFGIANQNDIKICNPKSDR